MNRPTDPAFEIRDALDREVRRRLDADRLCAALEDDARAMRAAGPAIHGGGGPLSRVPAAVQWVGIAAAVIAALTGLRSLYVDLSSEPPAPPIMERAAVEPGRPDVADPLAVTNPDEPAAPVPEPTPVPELRPAPVVAPEAAAESAPATPVDPEEKPTTDPASTSVAQAAPRPVASIQRSPQAVPVPPPARKTAPRSPSRQALAPRPEPTPSVPQPGSTTIAVTGGVEFPAPAVREASFRVAGTRLSATVTEVPNLGATLVTLSPSGGVRVLPDRPSRKPSGASGIPATPIAASVDYYVRVLVGSTLEFIPETRHAWLGDETDVVPALRDFWFGSDPQRALLTELFDLRSLVASDNVRIGVTDGFADVTLEAAAAGKLYGLSVKIAPAEGGDGRRLDVGISRRSPTRRAARKAGRVEASLLIDEGSIVLIALPDVLFDRRPAAGVTDGETVFVAVSTGSTEFADSIRRFEERIVERPGNPPIRIGGWEPEYPAEALDLNLAAHGSVTLRAMVLEDGSVHAIRLVEAPSFEGAELLIEAAAGAVRNWRYLPAQDRGRPVATWVEVEVEF